jgi:hypothetical protein
MHIAAKIQDQSMFFPQDDRPSSNPYETTGKSIYDM